MQNKISHHVHNPSPDGNATAGDTTVACGYTVASGGLVTYTSRGRQAAEVHAVEAAVSLAASRLLPPGTAAQH